MRRLPRLLLAALAFLHASCLAGPIVLAGTAQDVVATYERFDAVGFLWPPPANPFDPAEADVRGEFRDPDGRVTTLPAFFTRGFTRALAGGVEHLTPYGLAHWRTRFTPTRPGAWAWRWVATTPDGRRETDWRPFTVTPPDPGRHGFLRTSPDDPRFLRFDDGAPYLARGLNLCWYDARGTFAYDDWLAKLAAQGATYVRLWMPSWAFGLEWIRRDAGGRIVARSLGDYRDRLDRAWQLDHVIESAARHGIQVMLSLQNHGAFSLTANSEWADSPYNAANGGPLAEPREFFTDPAARELFRRRLRYVVARWGYAPNVLAFELWNEVDLADSPGVQPVRDWHVEMAEALRALDPYDHLVTTSITIAGDLGLFALPEIDLAQLHFYAYPGVSDLPESIPFLLAAVAAPGKPVLAAEIGVDYRGPAETIARDPTGVGVHDALWAGVLAGSLGTGMSWWWDNVIDPLDLWPHWGPVARATEGIAFDREGFVAGGAVAASASRPLRAYALRGARTVLAWVRNTRHQWYPPVTGLDPTAISDGTLALSGLADGAWEARWIDTLGGADLAVAPVHVAGGAATLAIPTFVQDVALRLERR